MLQQLVYWLSAPLKSKTDICTMLFIGVKGKRRIWGSEIQNRSCVLFCSVSASMAIYFLEHCQLTEQCQCTLHLHFWMIHTVVYFLLTHNFVTKHCLTRLLNKTEHVRIFEWQYLCWMPIFYDTLPCSSIRILGFLRPWDSFEKSGLLLTKIWFT